MHINILNPCVYIRSHSVRDGVSKEGRTMTIQVDRTKSYDSRYSVNACCVAGTGLNIYILHGTITLYRRLLLSTFTVKTVHSVFEWDAISKNVTKEENKCCLENYKINITLF